MEKKKKAGTPRFPEAVQRKDGKWECFAQASADCPKDNGRPYRVHRVGSTKRETENKAYEARDKWEKNFRTGIRQAEKGKKTEPLGKYMEEWLKREREGTVQESTYLKSVQTARTYFINRKIGSMQARNASAQAFEELYEELSDRARCIRTDIRSFSIGMCGMLVKQGILPENYAAEAEVPKKKYKTRDETEGGTVLSDESYMRLIQDMRDMGGRYSAVFIFQAECMMRESEVFALTYADIDLEKRTVHITKTVAKRMKDTSLPIGTPGNTERYEKLPKNNTGRYARLSALAEEAAEMTKTMQRRGGAKNPHGLICPKFATGGYISASDYEQMWIKTCRRIGIPRKKGEGPHILRRTGISESNSQTEITNTALAAGHRDIRTDYAKYTKQTEESIAKTRTPGDRLLRRETPAADDDAVQIRDLLKNMTPEQKSAAVLFLKEMGKKLQ